MPSGSSTNEKQTRTYRKLGGVDGQVNFILDNAGNQVIYFGDKAPYIIALRVDSGDTKLTYVGKADAGTATSAALWQILRLDETTGLTTLRADGNASFDNIFDNREALSYS